jgi:hypothetical protein
MFTAIQIMYVFIALQLKSDSTGTALNGVDESLVDPWSFSFSLAAAIGSIATAIALYFIWKQSRLAEERMRLTKEELKVTLPRPWIGAPEISYSPDKKELLVKLKNFGHFPGRVTVLKARDSESHPNRNDIAGGYANRTEITIFPEHERSYTVPATGEALPFVGFIVEYAYGTEDKKGLYGVIYQYSPPNRFAIKDEWFE